MRLAWLLWGRNDWSVRAESDEAQSVQPPTIEQITAMVQRRLAVAAPAGHQSAARNRRVCGSSGDGGEGVA